MRCAHPLDDCVKSLKPRARALERLPNAPEQSTRLLPRADTILDTFSALLRIAQIEAGTRTAGFRDIDLSELFETVLEAYSVVAEDEGKSLSARVAPSLKVHGDRDLITEMLANLIDNAIRHTSPGTHIQVSLANRGSQLVASVTDDGPGVGQSERERIFRRFYRLEKSMRTPGNGLGLSLVTAVAELHGMELSASDNATGITYDINNGFDFARRPKTIGRADHRPIYAAHNRSRTSNVSAASNGLAKTYLPGIPQALRHSRISAKSPPV